MSVSGVFVGRGAELGVLTAAVARARVLIGVCVELGGDGLPYAPFTAALRGRFPALAPDAGGDAGTARVRLFERVLELLDGLAAEDPPVLVIEDAHWADGPVGTCWTSWSATSRRFPGC